MSDDHTFAVWGASDDLIEVEKDGEHVAEFYADADDAKHVMVGDTEVCAEYTVEGEWAVSVVDLGEDDDANHYSVGRKGVVHDLNDYTEAVVVHSPRECVAEVDR